MGLKDRLAELPVVGTAMRVQERTKRDAADQFAAAIAFFGFISVFPLMAIAVAVSAAILAGQPERIEQVVEAIQGAIPGMGSTGALEDSIAAIQRNSGSIGLVGAITLLFTGLRVTNASQTATRFVFDLPLADASPVKLRLWQLLALVVLGVLTIAGVAANGLATTLLQSELVSELGPVLPVLSYVVGVVLDILLFWVAYRLYTFGSELSWRDLVPGAVLGGIGWSVLKTVGGAYAASQGNNAGAIVGGVIGLLLVFYLAGRFYVYGAELSAELAGLPATDAVPAGLDAAGEAPAAAAPDDRTTEESVATGPAEDDEPAGRATAAAEVSLAERFRERGRLADESVGEGPGTDVVPWQAPISSPLQDRRTRQVAAFASSALAVVAAGLLGRRR